MNPTQQTQWKDAVLDEILRAVSAHGPLRESLVFKGARILNLHLHTQRQSLDIDANLRVEFQQQMPDHPTQVEWFEGQLSTAIRNHYEDQDPVRYELESVKAVKNPSGLPHPRGWDGLIASIRVNDQKMRGVRSLPTVKLEIASPEKFGPDAVCNLPLDGANIPAYGAASDRRREVAGVPDIAASLSRENQQFDARGASKGPARPHPDS